MKALIILLVANLSLATTFGAEPTPQARAARARAYQLYEQKQFERSAEEFKRYLDQAPDDFAAAADYANLLSQLDRHAEAARVLESIQQKQPQNESASFKLAAAYIALKRLDDAEKLFSTLEQSANRDMAAAARAARARLRAERARQSRYKAEEHIYRLASESKHEEVVREIEKLERLGELSREMEMQRLYAMVSLRQYPAALERANRLERKSPGPDLAMLRADLYNQLGRRAEAETIWRRVERDHARTEVAAQARRRLSEKQTATPEDRVYDLARRNRHREVIDAINELERSGRLSPAMELQRLYAWQATGQTSQALDRFDLIWSELPQTPQLSLLHADLLLRAQRWEDATVVLQRVRTEQPDTAFAVEAQNRLSAMPEIANLDKWYWGEAYLSGDYLGRYGTVVGSGFIRHGYYLPQARWLQPYAELRFSADTRSGAGRRGTIITDNFLGLYGGIRAQLLSAEYLFVYGQGGINKDFLDRREDGDGTYDYQAGVYGFKSWGPGTILHQPSEIVQTRGVGPATPLDGDAARTSYRTLTNDVFWRGDWFTDVGADFSYYHRYASWIGYGQAHQGLRLWQLGPAAALDGYLVENIAWDVRGNFYDNLFEIGPGVRLLWVPRKRWEVVLRTEWLHGFYFGRDELNNRGGADSSYDNFHVGLSVGLRW